MSEELRRLNTACIHCLLNKYTGKVPEGTPEPQRLAFTQRVLRILAEAPPQYSAPEIVEQFTLLRREMFGEVEEYRDVKRYYNTLLAQREESLWQRIQAAERPLELAARYAMLGNYIDFGAMEQVDDGRLCALLDAPPPLPAENGEWDRLLADLAGAGRLVYLTDNCGEIVLDKLLLRQLRQQYPTLQVEAIVRGGPVLNDATLEDAVQVGLDRVVPVSGNGTAIAGTCLDRICDTAREKIQSADVILAKGQGNFETLRGCGRNVYYLFLCKCGLFADRFGVPPCTGMLVNELRMPIEE